MRYIEGICFFLFVIMAFQVHAGDVYYVDASTGSNDNDGLSEISAWKTISKVNEQYFQPGDSILFKRGEEWHGQLAVSSSGASNNPVIFGAYGTGVKPIINGSELISGWVRHESNIWKITGISTAPKTVIFNKIVGIEKTSLENLSKSNEWSWYSNVLYIYSKTDPNFTYKNPGIKVFVNANNIRIAAKKYITIQDISLKDWADRGIYGTNCDGLVIQRCQVTGGDRISPDHGIQIQRTFGDLMTSIRIIDNTISSISITEFDTETFNGILVQGVNRAVISGNNVNTKNTVGIRLILGGIGDNQDCLIEDNDVYGCYGGILNHNSDRTIIRYNIIRDGKGIGIGVAYDSDNIQIYYNLIYNITIKSTNLWNGIDINHDSQSGEVYNNTIYGVHGNCFVIDDATKKCDGWMIKNNIFDATQNESHDDMPALPYRLNGSSIYYTSDYNILNPKNQTLRGVVNPVVFDWDANVYYTLADHQKYNSQEFNSLDCSPIITDPNNADFSLQSSSPCIDTGIDVNLKQDITGNLVPYGGKVDIGAFEYVESDLLTVEIAASQTSGWIPLEVDFTCTVIGGQAPYTYNWDFDDENNSNAENPSHTYTFSGEFTVNLTVTDASSNKNSDSIIITAISNNSEAILSLSSLTGNPSLGNGGTTDPSPGVYSYATGSSVQISSIEYTNYRFSMWTGDINSSAVYENDINPVMDQNRSISANFCTKCGDLTGDLSVTPADAQVVFDIYLGKTLNPTRCQKENGDMNCDGTTDEPKITPADAQAIFDKYLGLDTLPGNCSNKSRAENAGMILSRGKTPNKLNIIRDGTSLNMDEYIYISIVIETSHQIRAFGFDLKFNSGNLKFMSATKANLTKNFHQVEGYEIMSGVVRVGGYSSLPIERNSAGDLVFLIFKIIEDVKDQIIFSVQNLVDDFDKDSLMINIY